MKTPLIVVACIGCFLILSSFLNWGFFAHQRINRLAIFTLPPELISLYKQNAIYIEETAVSPDRRRFFSVDEAPRHYIDLDHYGDNAIETMPRYWKDAADKFSEDTLKAYGIVPWHIQKVYNQLRNAFAINDTENILRLSAELGHYVADAHVPLHTTENYNGQLTGQDGIHAFWESRLPELFSDNYDFFVGKASHIDNVQIAAWKAVFSAHRAVDSVLREEKRLSEKFGEKKYSFESKGKQTQKVYSVAYSKAYHQILNGMVEKQMRASIVMIGSLWYSAWIDAGQPDVKRLLNYQPSEEELRKRKEELDQWRKSVVPGDHDQ